MAESIGADELDTIVIGSGPSGLILSYILSGHIPYYVGGHGDRKLDKRLLAAPNLLHVDPQIYSHLEHAVNYSSQALPINTLLDTLVRPNGDVGLDSKTCVEWRHEPDKAVSHVLVGDAAQAGGQWANAKTSWDVGSLSYAEQLSLPGYSLEEHWMRTKHEALPDFIRPTRNDVTDYLRTYPEAVGIEDNIRTCAQVSNVSRTSYGFLIEPFNIGCRHLVLASGTFNVTIPPPRLLRPLSSLQGADQDGAILIIGSGFTAADLMISTPPHRKIVHLFNWDPVSHPSPLKSCHSSAYPEYAWIYRQMKLAALQGPPNKARPAPNITSKPRKAPTSSTRYFCDRDWNTTYLGFANADLESLSLDSNSTPQAVGDHDRAPPQTNGRTDMEGRPTNQPGSCPTTATVTISTDRSHPTDATTANFTISAFHYATGRRGSLTYLNPALLSEVLPAPSLATTSQDCDALGGGASLDDLRQAPDTEDADAPEPFITGGTLRTKIETQSAEESVSAAGLELARDVFVTGSLTGDSLIRFAVGGCCAVAGAIMERRDGALGAHRQDLWKGRDGAALVGGDTANVGDVDGPDTERHKRCVVS